MDKIKKHEELTVKITNKSGRTHRQIAKEVAKFTVELYLQGKLKL